MNSPRTRAIARTWMMLAVAITAQAAIAGASQTAQPAATATAPASTSTTQTKSTRVAALGPVLGHVGVREARVWARLNEPGEAVLWVIDAEGKEVWKGAGKAAADHDLCVTWDVQGLAPATRYWYALRTTEVVKPPPMSDGGFGFFTTAPEESAPAVVSIAFGSCIGDPLDQAQPIWTEIARQRPDAMCLIGDTPYIDTTALDRQRRKYRELFSVPELLAMRRSTALYGIWDDHDFGKNDTDGNLKGKEHSRQAFIEYHANAVNPGQPGGLGETGEGIYSSFRRGPVEVFLIDARWFSGTTPSWADPSRPTLIGAAQWAWLKKGLSASTAPFKLLVTGMIWNESVRSGKSDYWGAYPHERSALWKWIGEQKIPGVVLVGGDIHRSRVLKHPSASTGVAYPLYELIASPLGSGVHTNANVPHPALVWDAGQPRCFMILTADSVASPPRLTARYITDDGREIHRVDVPLAELQPAR